MVETGLVEETKHLLEKHGRIPNLVNTIGYREILGYIDNQYSLDEAKELLKRTPEIMLNDNLLGSGKTMKLNGMFILKN